ncbi:ABC transporter permease [Terrimonas alba]|uniref:ABC transporter permease n=1 Tax=Terrimonas alba TaxID=3349636 RepID=UPI0035F4B53D
MKKNKQWDWEIKPAQEKWHVGMAEIIHYKDLLLRFTQRDLSVRYKQTIIGPFWNFLQPLMTTFVYFFVFGKIAKISTDGAPPVLFFLGGTIIWTFFSDCFQSVQSTFISNAHIFSKVYFPRLVVPLSSILSQTIRFLIQLLLFILIYLFYFFYFENVYPNWYILLLPLLMLLTAGFALGLGLIASVFVAKYRDLESLTQILLRLFMFATPVIYPLSIIPEKYKPWFWLNPLTWILETFRSAFLTRKEISFINMTVCMSSVLIVSLIGMVLFKNRELKVMDTI